MAPYSPLGQRGHGLFGQLDFPRGPHPAVRAQLLDPHSPTWRRGNLYLRAFSRDLDLLLAELVRKVVNPNLTAAERARARSDLAHLRRRLARHGRPSARRPGRPPKLTANEREAMADEHERLLAHLRDLTSNHSPSAAELDQLFATRGFADRLLGEFPCRGLESGKAWKQFLENTARQPLSPRCICYLALRYNVSTYTIEKAIWPPSSTKR